MKIFAVLTAAVVLVAGGMYLLAQKGPVTLSDADRERLRRTAAELQTLQLRYQNEASGIVREQSDIMTLYCGKAGLAYGPQGNCSINDKGEVFKTVTPPPAAKR